MIRQQLESDLRRAERTLLDVKPRFDTEVESESVIGIHATESIGDIRQLDENDTALYDIWIREVWMHQVGNDWRIHHEIWQIYENVPNF